MSERIAPIMSATTYAVSGGSSLFGVYTANEIAALGGLTLAALTFVVNAFYRHKMYQLEKIKAQAVLEQHDSSDHRPG